MKIAYVITGLACGGAEVQLATICNELKNKHSLRVYSIAPCNEIIDRFKGVDVVFYDLTNPMNIFKIFFDLKTFDPDVIHSHMIHSNIISPLLAFLLRKKCFITSHNTNEGSALLSAFLKFSVRIFKPKVSHVSLKGVDSYKSGGLSDNIELYLNPIDLSKFSSGNINRNSLIKWVNIASLTKQKRQDRLIFVFDKYLKLYPDDKLYIYGSGPEKEALKDIIRNLGRSSSIILEGQCNDISNVLSTTDYFILTSDWEGLPVSIIEALSSNVPVVSTDCGDISTVIKDAYNGLICSKNESEILESMLNIRKLSNDDYKRMANNANVSTRKYSVDSIASRLVNDYESSQSIK